MPDRRSGWLTGWSFGIVVVAWFAVSPPPAFSLVAFVACLAMHAFASSVEFEIGPGSALPTTPVLFAAAHLLPAQLLPVVAVGGLAIAAQAARLRDPARRERFAVLVGSGWHALGAAAVFAAFGPTRLALSHWPVYGAALIAQFAADSASSWVRNCYGLGLPTRQLVGALRFTFLVDLLVAPIGITAALALPSSPLVFLFLLGPILLLAMLQRDRRLQLDRVVALGEAVDQTAERARRDVLTGLHNRLAWEEALAALMGSPERVGVVLADVDGLKAANDRHGHDAGDRLIVAVGAVLAAASTGCIGAVVARLGGDEFGILLPGELADRVESVQAAARSGLATHAMLDGVVPVSASLGRSVAATGAELGRALAEADRGVNDDKTSRGVRRR